MRWIIIILTILTFNCSDPENIGQLTGSWQTCMRDGTYREYKITNDYLYFFESNMNPRAALARISYFSDSVIIEGGLNEFTPNFKDTLYIKTISKDHVQLIWQWGTTDLKRLENNIPDIDSTNLIQWGNQYVKNFQSRSNNFICEDIRPEEDKNPDIISVPIEDDYEELDIIINDEQ